LDLGHSRAEFFERDIRLPLDLRAEKILGILERAPRATGMG
jgi:hypothetical protein